MHDISRRAALTCLGGGLAALGLSACGGAGAAHGAAGTERPYRIGVLQLVEHEELDAANRGFVEALDEAGLSYVIDQQNAQGDQTACQTIASKLVGEESDLILAIATPAAIACAGATEEIPIIATAITDFASAGLVNTDNEPGANVTGTSDLIPVAEQIRLLHAVLPEAKRVGVLWCSAEANSALLARLAGEACVDCGIEADDYTVSASNEIQSVVESMAGQVDAIYIPTDNTIAAGLSTVSMVADDRRIPIVAGWEEAVREGALCTYAFPSALHEELGQMAGRMAVRILRDGADPATMPVEYCPTADLRLVFDEEKAKAFGIEASVWERFER